MAPSKEKRRIVLFEGTDRLFQRMVEERNEDLKSISPLHKGGHPTDLNHSRNVSFRPMRGEFVSRQVCSLRNTHHPT